jgi:hypothetical protein
VVREGRVGVVDENGLLKKVSTVLIAVILEHQNT